MKMQFTIVLKGEEVLEKKFQKAIEEKPELNVHLVSAFGQILALAFGFAHSDNVCIESFRAAKVDESALPPTPQPEIKESTA